MKIIHRRLRIGVVNIYNFPFGLAPTTRITAYCKGLISEGHRVDIFSIQPQEIDSRYPLQGHCDGGNYYHFSRLPKYRIPLVTGWILIFYNIIKTLCYIVKFHKITKYDAVILSFDEPYLLRIFSSFLRRLKGVKVIAIADEYPIPIRKYLKESIPISKVRKYKSIYKNIDARILMTAKLQCFYDNTICHKPTLLLSTIVDVDRFKDIKRAKVSRDYLCYMGNMELSKDNVDNIILAFALVKDKYPELDLYLYGAPSSTTCDYLKLIIKENFLEDRVFIKGKVSYGDVPNILANAKILVSSQPDTKRAEGGFPTKLGEYFMAGVPTLLTDVGEISQYVQNNHNGYIVSPCNPQLYALAIENILEDYDNALIIAQNAKKYVLSNFSCISAGNLIANFILTLNQSNL